ncbi:DinB family protein [Acidicapsa dinghuensis]|uniref:DinB family protein n=1 Tax=Acidicapsa dinghuensis TaxID=2218256 RepID=A0ABW1EN14_9BACT|nr:DinB family protein [Acidicapsa dinghuensis]
MEPTLESCLPLLSQTPATLTALLQGLTPAQLDRNEGGDSWNAREVVAHLIHTDQTNWMPRIRHIIEFGESQPFPPFSRTGQRELDLSCPIADLLKQFTETRHVNLDALLALQLKASDFALRGHHPVLGIVTISQLLSAWTTHDLTHLHQLIRLLADPFREAVGPFHRFLGVLQCQGHSSPA